MTSAEQNGAGKMSGLTGQLSEATLEVARCALIRYIEWAAPYAVPGSCGPDDTQEYFAQRVAAAREAEQELLHFGVQL